MEDNILIYGHLEIPEEEVCGLPVRLYHHIFYGRVSQNFRIYGVHHKDALTDKKKDFEKGDIRIVAGSKQMKDNGFYEAEIECWNGTDWQAKSEEKGQTQLKNGFFPDDWSRKRVMSEIAAAREEVTISDWQEPVLPQKKSNAFIRALPSGQNMVFFIATPKKNRPKRVLKYTVSVFPYFKELG